MYDHAHLFRKPEVPGYNHSHLVKDAASAFAPALGGAGLGALAAHTLGGSPWLGALLGGGAGYLGADYINDAFGLGQPQPPAPPSGGGGLPTNPRAPQTVGPGETMTAPPRDPLAISRSPDSMLPPAPPKAPASPNAAPPGSLRPPPSHASTAAPSSVRPPVSPAAQTVSSPNAPASLSVTGGGAAPGNATLGGTMSGQPAPQAPILNGLYGATAPARPQTPLGLDPNFLKELELAMARGLLTPAQVQRQILAQRPDMRGITTAERQRLDQQDAERRMFERQVKRRQRRADADAVFAKGEGYWDWLSSLVGR